MMTVARRWFSAVFVVLSGAAAARGQFPVAGGMLDPAIDPPGKPFSYFWHPTDVIGVLGAPVAAEVTPEGYIYTGFGELMFLVGNPPEPVNVRIKTLRRGYLPVVEYELVRQQVRYAWTILAADLGGKLQGLPVCLAQVRVTNEAREPRCAFLSSAYRFSPPAGHLRDGPAEYRFGQRFDLVPKVYAEGQADFNPAWKYAFQGHALVRDGRLVYQFPAAPEPDQLTLALADKSLQMYRFLTGEVIGDRQPRRVHHYDTPMGVATYRLPLAPGASVALALAMPIVPLPADSEEARQVAAADFARCLRQTEQFWDGLVGRRFTLRFPERKVQETLLANTVFNLLAIDKLGDRYVTNVNKFQYHGFYGGSDTSHMRIAMDYLGLEEIARPAVLYSVLQQQPDGAFDRSDDRGYEYFGWNLWCLGRHWQLTRDRSFLEAVYPGVAKAMEWERRLTQKDPLGLFPPYVNVDDDAAVNHVRQTGPHFWALHGMRHAVAMAEAAGRPDDARRFTQESRRFRAAVEKLLAAQTAKSGGWIPPALEKTLLGNHWDNMMLLYPEPLFEPFDPRVTATIAKSRECYAEGILGYVFPMAVAAEGDQFVFNRRPGLHYWHTPDNAQNALVRGGAVDQALAVGDLYALLVHTTSTHAPQEFSTFPWSTRDYWTCDILPDGATSGRLVELMRNMLLREYFDDLYLFSAVSPEWLRPGRSIELRQAPSSFGPVSAELRAADDGWTVALPGRFRNPPRRVIVRIPWFCEVGEAAVDGRPATIADGQIALPPAARTLRIAGRIRPGTQPANYAQAVRQYQQEYARRYQRFVRTGSID
jgi:hypothetical protein